VAMKLLGISVVAFEADQLLESNLNVMSGLVLWIYLNGLVGGFFKIFTLRLVSNDIRYVH